MQSKRVRFYFYFVDQNYQPQGNNKGPDPSSTTNEPMRMFSDQMSLDDRKVVLEKLYGKIKLSLETLIKPSGQKESPAKTCRHLFEDYPEVESGK